MYIHAYASGGATKIGLTSMRCFFLLHRDALGGNKLDGSTGWIWGQCSLSMHVDVSSHNFNDFVFAVRVVVRARAETLAWRTFGAVVGGVAVSILTEIREQRDEVLVIELEQLHVLVRLDALVQRLLFFRLVGVQHTMHEHTI